MVKHVKHKICHPSHRRVYTGVKYVHTVRQLASKTLLALQNWRRPHERGDPRGLVPHPPFRGGLMPLSTVLYRLAHGLAGVRMSFLFEAG